MAGSTWWILLVFLFSPTKEGAISMDSTVMGVSRVYESQQQCHASAGQLQRRLAETAREQKAKIAVTCTQGWVYDPKDAR